MGHTASQTAKPRFLHPGLGYRHCIWWSAWGYLFVTFVYKRMVRKMSRSQVWWCISAIPATWDPSYLIEIGGAQSRACRIKMGDSVKIEL
jgi:hypothetical protein